MPIPKELGENSIMGSQNLKLYRQESSFRFHEWRPWLMTAWACHFAASILVIVWGCAGNHNRKYIPADVTTMDPTVACSKGFVNVFAPSMDDLGALVCCGVEVGGKARATANSSFDDGICSTAPGFLFFARRLARFPEAWLLPLFPLLLRCTLHVVQQHRQQYQLTSHEYTRAQTRLARRRFYLYIALIQVRGWILYLLFDHIEEYFFSPPSTSSSCWYERYLYPNYSSCQGQRSDFSDHIVLYFAQILPIPLTEVLHSFVVPFWKGTIGSNTGQPTRSFGATSTVPTMLACGMLYLYAIAFMGAYKTAVYFHTSSEIWNGYSISMLVQLPLFMLQCTSFSDDATTYFFGYASS
jgi:hypothetical protein